MTTDKHYYKELYKHTPVLKYILTTLGYTVYFGASIVFLSLFPLILIPVTMSGKFRHFIFVNVYRSFIFFLTRIYLPFVRLYKIVEDLSESTVFSNAPVIYIANHRSQLDGPIALSRLKKTGVLMKSSYARSPLFASFVKHANFISVDSSSVDLMNTALQRCKELLGRGENLLVFPEGSRSRSARLLPFKDLAFRLSIETKVPIIPIVIHTDFPIMAKIRNSLFPPAVMNLTIRSLPPLYPKSNERSTEFSDRIRKIMIDEIKTLDHGTYWECL
jgi:1-acyl-sn-glycerol-3-phosphate acyltransferase